MEVSCLEDAAFTSAKVQNDVGALSMRGQGDPKDAKNAGGQVRSAIESNFTMADGVITLPNLKYTVPGAEIDLKGHICSRRWQTELQGDGPDGGDGFADGGRLEGIAAEAG